MAGIYIHIPFCKQACHYCNFHFSTSLTHRVQMTAAIGHELELKAPRIQENIETIYFGGGTPSLLNSDEISRILDILHANYSVVASPEITLEANPDDILPEKAKEWFKAGINRLSIGIQSFDTSILAWMNRAHSGEQAWKCIDHVRQSGFENLSIDLIYGVPQQSTRGWEKDLYNVFDLKIPHVSCYALTLEEKTAWHHLVKSGVRENVNPDQQADFFNILLKQMQTQGYEHYEISNFCLPGMQSKHNTAYWEGKPYLGIGPSAHSFDSKTRSWNVSNNMLYIQSIESNTIPEESEELSKEQQLNEYIMTSLRTSSGIDKKRILNQWGPTIFNTLSNQISQFIQRGTLEDTPTHWKLSEEGKFLADGIAADLFVI